VASNYRVPSVVLFGPVSPYVWGPPPHPRHQVLWYGDGRGDPHGTSPDPALLKISIADVLAAAERALAAEQ
jgi:ADP-heptose:LPS heptosyltransferase